MKKLYFSSVFIMAFFQKGNSQSSRMPLTIEAKTKASVVKSLIEAPGYYSLANFPLSTKDQILTIAFSEKGYKVVTFNSSKMKDGEKLNYENSDSWKSYTSPGVFSNLDFSAISIQPFVVELYGQQTYRGETNKLAIGEYTLSQLGGFSLNSLSSMKIPEGLIVTIYDEDNFKGNNITVSTDIPDLSLLKFDKKVKSLKIEEAVVTVYEKCGFGGNNNTLSVGRYNLEALKNSVKGSLSAIKIPKGYVVKIYDQDNFVGNVNIFKSDSECLVENKISSNAKSMIIEASTITDNNAVNIANSVQPKDFRDISIYPNPAKDNFFIDLQNFDLSEKFDISIYDIKGNKVKMYNKISSGGSNKILLSVDNLVSGIYYLDISSSSYHNRKSLIVKK